MMTTTPDVMLADENAEMRLTGTDENTKRLFLHIMNSDL